MNRIYKTARNRKTGQYVAVAEIVKRGGPVTGRVETETCAQKQREKNSSFVNSRLLLANINKFMFLSILSTSIAYAADYDMSGVNLSDYNKDDGSGKVVVTPNAGNDNINWGKLGQEGKESNDVLVRLTYKEGNTGELTLTEEEQAKLWETHTLIKDNDDSSSKPDITFKDTGTQQETKFKGVDFVEVTRIITPAGFRRNQGAADIKDRKPDDGTYTIKPKNWVLKGNAPSYKNLTFAEVEAGGTLAVTGNTIKANKDKNEDIQDHLTGIGESVDVVAKQSTFIKVKGNDTAETKLNFIGKIRFNNKAGGESAVGVDRLTKSAKIESDTTPLTYHHWEYEQYLPANLFIMNTDYSKYPEAGVDTVVGKRKFTKLDDFKKFNQELIAHVESQSYPNMDAMKKAYNDEINKVIGINFSSGWDTLSPKYTAELSLAEIRLYAADQALTEGFTQLSADEKTAVLAKVARAGVEKLMADGDSQSNIAAAEAVAKKAEKLADGLSTTNTEAIATATSAYNEFNKISKDDNSNLPNTDIKNGIRNVFVEAKGEKTTVKVEKDAEIYNHSRHFQTFYLSDNAKLVNEGGIIADKRPVDTQATWQSSGLIELEQGADLENKGFIAANSVNGTPIIYVNNATVTNTEDGVIHSLNKSNNRESTGVALHNGAQFINKGLVSLEYTSPIGFYKSSAETSKFINAKSGRIVSSQELTFNIADNDNKISIDNTGKIYNGYTTNPLYNDGVKPSLDDAGDPYAGLTADKGLGVFLVGVKDNGLNTTGEFINNGEIHQRSMSDKWRPYINVIDIASDKVRFTQTKDGSLFLNGDKDVRGIRLKNNKSAGSEVYGNIIFSNEKNNSGAVFLENSDITAAADITINGTKADNKINKAYWLAEGEKDDDSSTLNLTGGTIALNSGNSIGIDIRKNNSAIIGKDAKITFKNDGDNTSYQTGILAYGNNAKINFNSTQEMNIASDFSRGIRVEKGAEFKNETALYNLDASGVDSTIFEAADGGSLTIQAGDPSNPTTLKVSGEKATVLYVQGKGKGEIAQGVKAEVTGKGALVGLVDGIYSDFIGGSDASKDGVNGETVLTTHMELHSPTTAADDITGYAATKGGVLVHNGKIDFNSKNAVGIKVLGGAVENSSDGKIVVNGADSVALEITIAEDDIEGKYKSTVENKGLIQATDGKAAILMGEKAELALTGTGEIKAGGSAHAILLAEGAEALSIEGAKITMLVGGTGSAIENIANLAGIQLKGATEINVADGIGVHTGNTLASENTGTINISGKGVGIALQKMDGSATDKEADLSKSKDLIINADGENSRGITIKSDKNVTTAATINVKGTDAVGIEIFGATPEIKNMGAITVSGENAIAVKHNLDPSTSEDVTFTNAVGAKISGKVVLDKGNDTINLDEGSEGDIFEMGAGDDTIAFTDVTVDKQFNLIDGGEGIDTLTLKGSDDSKGAHLTLSHSGKSIKNIEKVNLQNTSSLTLDNTMIALGDDGDDTGYNISENSSLNLKNAENIELNSHIAGTGTINVEGATVATATADSVSGKTFNFTANNKADEFKGTVALTNVVHTLNDTNEKALEKATLKVGAGAVLDTGTGDVKKIGGLSLANGIVRLDNLNISPANAAGPSIDVAETLDVSSSTTVVQVKVDKTIDNSAALADANSKSLLEQDDAETLTKLIAAKTVTGAVTDLGYTDFDGQTFDASQDFDIKQNGKVAAIGTYDYGTQVEKDGGGDGNGLYMGYKLTEVDLKLSDADALILDSNNKTGSAAELTAKIIGTGDLIIKNSGDSHTVLSLSNAGNDYTGKTVVQSGTLKMGGDTALGKTKELNLVAGTVFDMDGKTQTVGVFNGEANSEAKIGDLTITNGGTSAGKLTGGTALNVTGGKLEIIGANEGLTAATTIADGATIAINDAKSLNNVAISLAGDLEVNSADGKVANVLTGEGKVNLLGTADISLTADNSGLTDKAQININDGTKLTATAEKQLGSAQLDTKASGELNLDAYSGTVGNVLTGAGTVNLNNAANVTLTANNSGLTGEININDDTKLSATALNQLGSAQLNTTGKGDLTLTTAGDTKLANKLIGEGTVNASTGTDNKFDFDASVGTDFEGTLNITATQFELAGTNETTMANATLAMGADSKTSTGTATGKRSIKGLTFDTGVLTLDNITVYPAILTDVSIATDTMNIVADSEVRVKVSSGVAGTIAPDESVLIQDDEDTKIRLISANTVTGDANITLKDENGEKLSSPILDIKNQASDVTVAAKGTYAFSSSIEKEGDKKGLFVQYALDEVELIATGDAALKLDANGATDLKGQLKAKLTGSGDLNIDNTNDTDVVRLANSANSYTGVTRVKKGTLKMDADNVLGQTSELNLIESTNFDMAGHVQTVGAFNGAAGSTATIGDLTISNGGKSEGQLTGVAGTKLNVVGIGGNKKLTILGDNLELMADTSIAQDATVEINHARGLGNGKIDLGVAANNKGTLELNVTNDWDNNFTNNITGTGDVIKNGDGILVFDQRESYKHTGVTVVNKGELVLHSVDLTSTLINKAKTTFLNEDGVSVAELKNEGVVEIGKIGHPNTVQLTVKEGIAKAAGLSSSGDVNNNKDIYLGVAITSGDDIKGYQAKITETSPVGNSLTAEGNYIGSGDARLVFNTVLGDDSSETDKMIVAGNTSGKTKVRVVNVGGKGAVTTKGIELIKVGGISQATNFTQEGRIIAGAYDYTLQKGGHAADEQSWYLVNTATKLTATPTPTPTPTPTAIPTPIVTTEPTPVTPPEPGLAPVPTPEFEITAIPLLRPELGAYISNIEAANTMFVNTLHDRQGETQYVNALGQKKVASVWLRQVGAKGHRSNVNKQLESNSNRSVTQLGGDIAQWSNSGQDRWHLGLMGSHGQSNAWTSSDYTQYNAKAKTKGYAVGAYATWFQNATQDQGLYIDSWMQYSWFKHHVKGDEQLEETYRSNGLTASLEAGYTFQLSNSANKAKWHIQPKAQLVAMNVKAHKLQEINGTEVSSKGHGNIMGRLGSRVYMHYEDNQGRQFEPFVEASWISHSKDFAVSMNNEVFKQQGSRNVGEVKLGIEAQLKPQLHVWANISGQVGSHSYRDLGAVLGVKYNF